jgi:hypothetical protein
MATAISPKAERLAAALEERLGDKPLTARELAAELVELPVELIGALDEALAQAADEDAGELDEALWGPAPTATQLADARRVAARSRREALQAALAEALTRGEAAELLGISPQAVSKRHAAGALVALPRGREWRFPAWQFGDGGTLAGLAEVIAAYPGGALSLSSWAVAPNADLDRRTPAEELARRGGRERVLAALESIGPDAW